MFRKLKNFAKNQEKTPKIWHKTPKIRSFSLNPKHLLKSFLYWLRLRNEIGELIVKEETNINEIIDYWIKSLLLWAIEIIVTGFLIQIAILPFYKTELKLIPFNIFSFGVLYYTFKAILMDSRNIIKKGVI